MSAIRKTVTSAVLGAVCVMGISQAQAASENLVLGSLNADLMGGTYEFDNLLPSVPGGTNVINDTWSFTLAQDSVVDFAFLDPRNESIGDFPLFVTSITDFQFQGSSLPVEEVTSLGALTAGTLYTLSVTGSVLGGLGGGYDGTLRVSPAPVPLPAAIWMLGTGLLALTVFSRSRHQQRA